jgi:hypothetical protein
MNKNTTITMAAAVAGILTLAVLTVGLHKAFAGGSGCCCCDDNNKDKKQEKKEIIKVAVGGKGGSGGAGGAGGEGGEGGTNVNKDTKKADVDQDANGGESNGGHGGNANGGFAAIA